MKGVDFLKSPRGVTTTNIIARVPPYVKKLAEVVAKNKGMTISEYLRECLYESIEDEYDLEVGKKAYQEYLKNPVTIPWEEAERMLDNGEV